MTELNEKEMKLLLNKKEEVQEQFMENMSRGERRRLERVKKKDDAERAQYGGKLTTRFDVMQILGLYIERNLLPLAQRLDELEARVEQSQEPFWRRWRLRRKQKDAIDERDDTEST